MALPFFGIGMKTNLSSPVATAEFSKFAGILSATLSQHHLSGFEIAPSSKSLQTIHAGEDVEKGNSLALLVGMKIDTATMENSMEIP